MRVMARIPWLAAALALALAAPARAAGPPAAPPGFVELFKAATDAHQAKDYARMEQRLRDALKLRPGHPTALYKLAAAQALRRETGDAIDTLNELVRMGLSFEPERDEDFAGMRGGERFKLIVTDFRDNRRQVGEARVSFKVPDDDFIPEGLAFDEDKKHFFLGSVRERRIVRVKRDDTQSDFAAAGALWATLGMTADAAKRRLWVATAALPEMQGAAADELGRTAIVGFDLDTGEQKQRHVLPEDGRKHVLGDVVVGKGGTLYATDSAAGVLYALDPVSGKFDALTAPGALGSPQGLALTRDKKKLYVADYTQGLFRYDLDKRELTRLEVGRDICVYGIDGLYRYDDDELIAIQNGVRPHRVVRFQLERGGRRVRHATVLAANLPEFDEPTLGVLAGRRFHFVANSQWNKFGPDHRLPAGAQLRGPVVLEVDASYRTPRDDRRSDPRPQQAPQQAQPLPLPPVSLPPIR
jgi:sugar lactone lactonase YvrE